MHILERLMSTVFNRLWQRFGLCCGYVCLYVYMRDVGVFWQTPKRIELVFTARRNVRIASAVLATAIPSVCPSVRSSHAGIVSK